MVDKKKKKLKNRYVRNAKLSEYRFLKILKGFSMDKTIKELHNECGVSEKTLREIYRNLRGKLIEAVLTNRYDFGGAGFYLLRTGKLDEQGKRFLQGVAESTIFKDHIEHHAPRLNNAKDLQNMVFET